jgi:hypothetical protein
MARQEIKNQDYEDLLQHLKGFKYIVINTQHGGFGLTHDAQISYLEQSNILYQLVDRSDRHSTQRYGSLIFVNGHNWSDRNIPRDDPVLVDLVNKLGSACWGEHAALKIVQIPADVSWQIDDYDGVEWVAEQHRIWK